MLSGEALSFRRLRPIFGLVVAIFIALLLINASLFFSMGPYPRNWWMQQWLNPDERDRMEDQFSTASCLLKTPKGDYLPAGLILGLSTAREGFDHALLEEGLDHHLRIINLGTSGGSFQELRYYTEWLDQSPFKPPVTILGIHAVWMGGRPQIQTLLFEPNQWSEALHGGRNARQSREAAWQRLWIISNYRRIHNAFQNDLDTIRAVMMGHLDLPREAIHTAKVKDPFEPEHFYTAPRAPESFIRDQSRAFEEMGWFTPTTYADTRAQTLALQAILAQSERRASLTAVVLMPESQAFRQRVPEGASLSLNRALSTGYPPALIIDLRDALPEDAFYDLVHPNAKGRKLLTLCLASKLRPFLDRTLQ